MYKILIADDKKIERNGIMMLIKKFKLPFETAEATNGCDALEYIFCLKGISIYTKFAEAPKKQRVFL